MILVNLQSAFPRPLRIACVTETYPPEVNGVAMTMARLVEGLQQRGHFVALVRPRQSAADRAATVTHGDQLVIPVGARRHGHVDVQQTRTLGPDRAVQSGLLSG